MQSSQSSMQSQPPALQALGEIHDQAKAQFDKISETKNTIETMREQLDGLLKLGDMVEPDDVIKSAGAIIGHGGLSSMDIAKFLSDMPQAGGPPLMGWLQNHEQRLVGMEQQIQQAHALAAHHLGVRALHELAGHSAMGSGGSSGGGGSPNPLAGSSSPNPLMQ